MVGIDISSVFSRAAHVHPCRCVKRNLIARLRSLVACEGRRAPAPPPDGKKGRGVRHLLCVKCEALTPFRVPRRPLPFNRFGYSNS
jgi:hypothetical protein